MAKTEAVSLESLLADLRATEAAMFSTPCPRAKAGGPRCLDVEFARRKALVGTKKFEHYNDTRRMCHECAAYEHVQRAIEHLLGAEHVQRTIEHILGAAACEHAACPNPAWQLPSHLDPVKANRKGKGSSS